MTTREHVLSALEEHRGCFISGEQLASRLSLSRSAVWKAMRDLKASGYEIESSTKNGYRLRERSDRLSKEGILACLKGSIDYAPLLQYHESLPSTNREAKQLALLSGKTEAVVVSDAQTEGRGRYAHSFYSPAGSGIYLSILLSPERFPFSSPTVLTIYAAVAVCSAIESVTGFSPQIKWVNDLYLNEKKICGILTEAGTDVETGQLQWIVCGIGLNFRVPDDGFPEELPAAGALYPCEGADSSGTDTAAPNSCSTPPQITRNALAAAIIRCFFEPEHWLSPEIANTKGNAFQREVLRRYRDRLSLLGREVTVLGLNDEPLYTATAIDLDEEGHLIVRKADGNLAVLSSGDVCIKRPSSGETSVPLQA